MLEDDGHWLKLMRTATKPTDANICLRISGGDIVCTVTKDVNKEVELKVTCRIADPCYAQKPNLSPVNDENLKSLEALQHAEVKPEEREAVSKDCSSPQTMLDYLPGVAGICNETITCSTSLNSREVSEERSFKSESEIDMDDFKDEVSSSTTRESPSSDICKEPRIKSEEETSRTSRLNEMSNRMQRINDDIATQTSPGHDNSSSELHSRDKHLYSRLSPNYARNTTSILTNPKSFCDACKIQFMSVNTYEVHRKFYCKSRQLENESFRESMPVLEAAPGGLSAAFKPSPDTVILRGGVNGSVVPSVIQPQAIYAAISTNPLILLPCTLVPGQGLVAQTGVLPTGGPGLVLQSGIGCSAPVEKLDPDSVDCKCPPRKTSHPVMSSSAEDSCILPNSCKTSVLKRKLSEGDAMNLKKQCTSSHHVSTDQERNALEVEDTFKSTDSPIDLSFKTKKTADVVTRKSPIRRRSSVISTSYPHSPGRPGGAGTPPGTTVISSNHSVPSPTNSYSNDSSSFMSQVTVGAHRLPQATSDRISPLPPVLQSAAVEKPIVAPGMLPPKLMKQGSNICEECHIVFIKYDNLVTHKKHYCAYRRRQLSALAAAAAAAHEQQSSDDNNSDHSGSEENCDDPGKPGIRKQEYAVEQHYRPVIPKPQQPAHCCDACGVKFSTADTLIAHQTYYCMKRPGSAMAKASAKKSDDPSLKDIESPFSGPEEWKCNYCDATCASYDTIRRHLLTHTEPRNYRCVVCGYKGNTLRGMRAHACEHMSEDKTSVEEFMSNTIVSEGGVVPLLPWSFDGSEDESDSQKDSKNYKQRERTLSVASDVTKDKHPKRVTSDPAEFAEEHSSSPTRVENLKHETVLKNMSPIKTESLDSCSETSGNQEQVNPLAFCDVVIKTENETNNSGEESDRNESKIEQESDSNEMFSASARLLSVIRVAEQHGVSNSYKRKGKPQSKSNSDLKSCKSCGVSFQHLSNLVTHKKYYCVSRGMQNQLPETATVQ